MTSKAWPVAATIRRPSASVRLLASMLKTASAMLGRLAERVEANGVRPRVVADPLVEFHAEAGAPEGALYVNGEFAGWLPGVTRL